VVSIRIAGSRLIEELTPAQEEKLFKLDSSEGDGLTPAPRSGGSTELAGEQ